MPISACVKGGIRSRGHTRPQMRLTPTARVGGALRTSIVAQKWPHITLPKGHVELDVSRAHGRRSSGRAPAGGALITRVRMASRHSPCGKLPPVRIGDPEPISIRPFQLNQGRTLRWCLHSMHGVENGRQHMVRAVSDHLCVDSRTANTDLLSRAERAKSAAATSSRQPP